MFNGSSVGSWINQSASANRIQTVTDPDGSGGTALEFTVDDGDVSPLTPTVNPRAQLITPGNVVTEGKPFWESYSVYFPASWPVNQPASSWVTLGSPFYGAPYDGVPSVDLEVAHGQISWGTNTHAQDGAKSLWQMPVVTGTWINFMWHIIPSTNGFAELYVDGTPVVTTYDGVTGEGVNIPVIDASDDSGPWLSQLSLYYSLGAFSSLTAYFKDFRIAGTEDGVASP